MSNISSVTGKVLINKLCNAGYIILRKRGFNYFLTLHGKSMKSTVIQNTPKDIPVGTLLAYRKQ